MAEITRKDTMPLDDTEVNTSYVADISEGMDEEEVGVMGSIPLPGAFPTTSLSKTKKSSTSASSIESATQEEEPEIKVEIPDFSDLSVGENVEVALDENIPEPDLEDIEAISVMDDLAPDIEEPHMDDDIDEPEARVTQEPTQKTTQEETYTTSTQQKTEQASKDYSDIEEASGPTFVFSEDEEKSDSAGTEQSSTHYTQSESTTTNNDVEDDVTIESVVYEEGDEEFDGEKIKNAYKAQKNPLSTQAKQVIGFIVVILFFLLIFGISKVFNFITTQKEANTTEQSTEQQASTDSDLWFLEKDKESEPKEQSTQSTQFAPFTFTPSLSQDTTTEQATTHPNYPSQQDSTQVATESSTEVSAETPSVREILGITDTRFNTLDELTAYLNRACTTITTKTNDLVKQYQDGEISRNEYQSTLNTYYQAVVELAQLLVANKQVYADAAQSDTYASHERQIRDLSYLIEDALDGIQ